MKGYIMKKFLLFVVAALVFVGSATAQSLRFYDQEGNLYEENAVITSYEVESDFMNNTWHLNIKNTSDRDINVMIDVEVEEISGFFQFCGNLNVTVGTCFPYDPEKPFAPFGPYYAEAGSAKYYFHAALMCISETDYLRVKFTIYDESNPDDKTSMTVILSKEAYDKGSGVNDAFATQQVKVFQRGGNLVCNYNFNTTANRSIVVSNIVGACVGSVVLDGNNGEAVIDRLPQGVYVYTLVENGRNVKSHKVVIR